MAYPTTNSSSSPCLRYAFFMPEAVQSLPPSAAAGFASMLSGLIAPKEEAKPSDFWNDDALAQDVATLSYEQALRTHTRYRPSSGPNLSSQADSNPADPDAQFSQKAPSERQGASAYAEPRSTVGRVSSLEESRKSASITIRLSHTECELLRGRAAAAGLTVSAYLRSCVFEVESLRAQVKDTLVQLRATASAPEPKPVAQPAQPGVGSAPVRLAHGSPAKSSFIGWLLRFLFPRHRNQRMANA
jgi:predicted DNA binding CopG/RHH family protein